MVKRGNSDRALSIDGVIAINQELRAGLGEDTSICIGVPDGKAVIIACFDGCGGAGAKRYSVAQNWTGARLASHICSDVINEWFENNQIARLGMQQAPAQRIAESLKNAFSERLKGINEELDVTGPILKGSLSKSLPTTMAAVVAENINEQAIRCLFLWVGDSRGFLLSTLGLQQITSDDVKGKLDPLENIQNDGVLSNVISANGEFDINVIEIYIHKPCILITATDGCFSYFISPIEFEEAVLETLCVSSSLDDWERQLCFRLGRVASDDYTLQALVIGFKTFNELKSAFASRAVEFRRRFSDPLKRLKANNDRDGMARLWQEYKRYYMDEA